jgi:hypothetical protein
MEACFFLLEQQYASQSQSLEPKARESTLGQVDFLREQCGFIGLKSAALKCGRIQEDLKINKDYKIETVAQWLRDLRERIEDDLKSEFFLHLTQQEMGRYTKPLDNWEEIVDRFGEVRNNVVETMRCFALERYGAAVFHVTLVAEYGVIQVAKLMKVEGDKPGWGSLERLSKILEKPYAQRTSLEQKHSKLLGNVVPLTKVIKDNWRHKLDHVDNQIVWMDTDFSPNVAEEIISATRGFMRKLAKELPWDVKKKKKKK